MENSFIIILLSIILLLVVSPLLFFFRRSTDVRLEGDILVLRYPFKKEEINLSKELKSWILQEAYYFRLGKLYSINMELRNGKWKSISSRFNPENFQKILIHLESNYKELMKPDK